MIVKLMGNSGSGKTTAVRQLMDLAQEVTPQRDGRKVTRYRLDFEDGPSTYVLGSYENTCGGLDTIRTADEVIDLVRRYAPLGNIVMEGLLSSTYIGKLGEFLMNNVGKVGERLISYHTNWLFLDTPLEECISRVKARRLLAGDFRPFNEENTRNRAKPIAAARIKLLNMGEWVFDMDGSNPAAGQGLLQMLRHGSATNFVPQGFRRATT